MTLDSDKYYKSGNLRREMLNLHARLAGEQMTGDNPYAKARMAENRAINEKAQQYLTEEQKNLGVASVDRFRYESVIDPDTGAPKGVDGKVKVRQDPDIYSHNYHFGKGLPPDKENTLSFTPIEVSSLFGKPANPKPANALQKDKLQYNPYITGDPDADLRRLQENLTRELMVGDNPYAKARIAENRAINEKAQQYLTEEQKAQGVAGHSTARFESIIDPDTGGPAGRAGVGHISDKTNPDYYSRNYKGHYSWAEEARAEKEARAGKENAEADESSTQKDTRLAEADESSTQKDTRLRAEEYRRRIEENRARSQELGDKSRNYFRVLNERHALDDRREEIRQEKFAKYNNRMGQPPTGQPPTGQPPRTFPVNIGGKKGEFSTDIGFVDGTQKQFITSDRNMGFNPDQWQSILDDPIANKTAIDVLGNTTDAIAKLQTPEARQFTKLYNQIEADRKAIEQDTSLTENERKQAVRSVAERQSRLAAAIPDMGNIAEQLESQAMAQERADAAQAKKDAADNVRDYEGAYKSAQAIADKQTAEGIEVTPEQFSRIFDAEFRKREAVAQVIDGTTAGPAPIDMSSLEFSNPTGGLVYGSSEGVPFARVEGAGPSGPRIPTRALNGVVYPAPVNSVQVGMLHKGTPYFAPNSDIVSVKKTGAPPPNEAALQQREEEEAARVKFVNENYTSIMDAQRTTWDTYRTDYLPSALAELRVHAGANDEVFEVTEDMVLSGQGVEEALTELRENTLSIPSRAQSTLLDVPVDPDSEEGRLDRRKRINLALRVREEAKELTRQRDIENQERSAPYRNSVASFTPRIAEGHDIVTYTTDAGEEIGFEAFTITQRGSAFYGKSLPVIRNSSELMRISPDLYPNFAYYNPKSGRVLASVASKGSQRGEYTPEDARTIMSQLVELYPADFFDESQHFEEIFDAYTKYMGYSGPQK